MIAKIPITWFINLKLSERKRSKSTVFRSRLTPHVHAASRRHAPNKTIKKVLMTNCVISTSNGGGEGSRTPVQKHFHKNFSERSLCLFKFALLATQRHATSKTILLFPYATRSSRKVFLHDDARHPSLQVSKG